jgi:hypothetical protein
MSLRRQAIKLASTLQGDERRAILNAIVAADKEAGCEKLPEGPMRDNCEKGGPNGKGKKDDKKKDDKGGKKDDGKMPADLLEKFKGKKKASRSLLASFEGDDALLAREVIKLASRLPEHRSTLLDTLRQAAGEEDATVKTPGYDATEISEVEKGPLVQDADEPYMGGEFTQQEFHELGDKQELGDLAEGSNEPKKYAALLRKTLIRLASTMPKGTREKQDLLHFLASDDEDEDDSKKK